MLIVSTEPLEIDQAAPLPLIAADIRRLQKVVVGIRAALLRTCMDLGDRLAWARAQVSVRGWKAWREKYCPEISKRSDEVYRQLAAHRDRIEQELAAFPDLSLRQALGLIRPLTAKPRLKLKPPAPEKWQSLSADEKREGLAADGIGALLQYMPLEWRDELADRVARVKHKTARDRGLSARLREHIQDHPDDRLAKYIRDQAIDPKHLIVHVAAIDAPSRRRAPLVMHTGSAGVH
jgi:hypothetical protein